MRRFLAAAAMVLAFAEAATGTGRPAVAAEERRVALVIGNSRYRQGGAAAAVGGNVDVMVAALRRAGFAVTAADDLDRRAMQAELSRFREALGQADLGFVYYSGLVLETTGGGYLLPADAALAVVGDAGREALDLGEEVIAPIARTGKRTILVLDPAAANPFADRLGRLPDGDAKPALGQPPEADRLFLVYSHRPGVPPVPVPMRGAGPDPFTAALAREMVRPGVPFRDSLAEVARATAERTGGRQIPWLQDRIGGDLVLVPGPPPQTVAAKPPAKPEIPKPEIPKPEANKPEAGAAVRTIPEPPPSVSPPAPPAPSPGSYAVTRPGTLFAQPAIGARGLFPLAAGTLVTVVEAVPGGNWLRVRDASGREGFVTAGVLAGSWTTADSVPPVAQAPRTPVEREPLAGSAGPGLVPPSGASDPSESEVPAIRAERQAYRAQQEARSAAAQARNGTTDRLWSYGFANGDVYQGTSAVVSDRMPGGRPVRQGFGLYRFAGGQLYEGEWLDDAMAGYGVLSFPNGDRHAGTFRNGRPDGPGVYRYADGTRRVGVWRGSELAQE